MILYIHTCARCTLHNYYVLYSISSLSFCSRETYNALTNWLTDARTLASPNIVIVLVGNKKDLEADREVTFMEASRFSQENGRSIIRALLVQAYVAQQSNKCLSCLGGCRTVISGDKCSHWGECGGGLSQVYQIDPRQD